MAATIRIKRSGTAGNPSTLAQGELAYSSLAQGLPPDVANGGDRLYVGTGTETAGDAANHVVIGGKYYVDLLHGEGLATWGTVLANKALIADSDKVIGVNGGLNLDFTNNKIVGLVDPTVASGAATKKYVDSAISNNTFTISDGTASDVFNTSTGTLTFSGSTGITTSVTDDQVAISITDTGVTADTYGSTTQIPVLTINSQGQITNATTSNVATSLSIDVLNDGSSAATDTISLLDSSVGFNAGEGLNVAYATATNRITISGEDATTTNKGIASFNTNDFSVASGAVSIKTGGVSNLQLANSSVTFGTTTVALGASSTDIAGVTQLDVDNIRIDGNTISSTDVSNTLYIDPAPVDSDGGDLIIRGNLIVQGVTTTVNSTEVTVTDLQMTLADSAVSEALTDGAGIIAGSATTYTGTRPSITYDGASNRWDFNKSIDVAGTDLGAIQIGGTALRERIEDHLASTFFQQGEGMDITYDDNANTLTFAAELATVTNPGVANFDSDQMQLSIAVTGRNTVSIYNLDGGTY